MAHLYFFERTQSSQSDFNSKLQTAINLIRQNNSLVALKVIEVIDSDQVSIRSFFDLSKEHWRRMKHDMKKEDNINLPNTYPPSEHAVKMIEKELNGIIYEDRYIYISRKRTPEQMASTLVHEICHFLNARLMEQERQTINSNLVSHNEEVRSFAAEKMFERDGHCLRRSDIKELHEMVTDLYPEFNDTGDDEPQLGYIFASYDSPIN